MSTGCALAPAQQTPAVLRSVRLGCNVQSSMSARGGSRCAMAAPGL